MMRFSPVCRYRARYPSCSSWYGDGMRIVTFCPISSAEVYPKIRSVAGLIVWIVPRPSIEMMASNAVSRIPHILARPFDTSASIRLRSDMSRAMINAPMRPPPVALMGEIVHATCTREPSFRSLTVSSADPFAAPDPLHDLVELVAGFRRHQHRNRRQPLRPRVAVEPLGGRVRA